jgi:hypothetical protein
MPIGELLIQQGLITPAQLDAGLRTQEQYGGRLASILVDLKYVDGDLATRALAKLKKVPAALQKHFDAAEPSAIARIPRKVAEKYSAVPLGWAGEAGSALIVAMVEPNDLLAVEEMRFLAGTKLIPGIAIELRIINALERWYGVQRRAAKQGFVKMHHERESDDIEPTAHVVPPSTQPPPPDAYRAVPHGPLDLTLDAPVMPPSSRQPASIPASLPPFVARKLTPPNLTIDPAPPSSPIPTITNSSAPARRSLPPPLPREDPDEAPLAPQGRSVSSPRILLADQAIVRIQRAHSFDERVDNLISYLRGAFEAGVVFAVRNDIAFSWKAFGPAVRGPLPPKIAVPLTQPSLLILPYEARTTFFGTPSAEGSELNARIWKALGTTTPREALALPIVIDEKVAAIVYAHPRQGERIAPSVLVEVANVCAVVTKR